MSTEKPLTLENKDGETVIYTRKILVRQHEDLDAFTGLVDCLIDDCEDVE